MRRLSTVNGQILVWDSAIEARFIALLLSGSSLVSADQGPFEKFPGKPFLCPRGATGLWHAVLEIDSEVSHLDSSRDAPPRDS